MNFFDLHCDTLYKAATENSLLDNPEYQVKINHNPNFHKLQCYAIWLPDDLSGDKAESLFFKSAELLKNECKRLNIKLFGIGDYKNGEFYKYQNSAFFTVENAKALNGKLENIQKFADLGVRIMTLTWNAQNELGSGVLSGSKTGLTEFGKLALNETEHLGIVCDISHASEPLFYDVASRAKHPFIATHSNARAVADNPRNLTDEQIKEIVHRGGLIGLNLHNAFLNTDPAKANMTDILRHCEYFLAHGCENVLCFGTDFDGCDLPSDIRGSESIDEIYELFLREGISETQIKKIFCENAHKFFENFDNRQNM